MKLALIGDLHLSERSARYAHVLSVLDWTIEDAKQRGADAFALLGDLFEGKPTPGEYRDLIERVLVMRDAGDVFLLLGNHEDHAALSFLGLFGVVTAWDLFVHVGDGILLVPYPRRGRPPFDGLADDGTIASSMTAAAERIGEEIRTRKPRIVLGHFTIEGMTTRDADFELHTATEVVVPRAAFAAVALAAVGHIHKAQDVAPNIIGVGSLIRHSFAEADDPKSYTLVTVDGSRVTWERRPVPARDMVVLRVLWGVGSDAPELPIATLAGKEVKLTVEIPEDQLATFDPSTFDPVKDVAAHFVLERMTVSAERTRTPEIAKADTLDRQFFTWMDAIGDSPHDEAHERRLREKLAEVQA